LSIMKDLVKFPLESGGFVFVETEITDAERGGLVKAGRGFPEEAAQSLEAAIKSLSPIANSIVLNLINTKPFPDEATVEFGFAFKAESLVIVKIGGDANFKITLKWRNESQTAHPAASCGACSRRL